MRASILLTLLLAGCPSVDPQGGTPAATAPTGPDHCRDRAADGDETDLDCGGACGGCGFSLRCLVDTDCASGHCGGGQCQGATLALSDGTSLAAGEQPGSLAAADFDHDGRIDLAAGDETGRQVAILLGRGDGDFRTASVQPLAGQAVDLAAADLDGDGHIDLAVALGQGGAVILRGRGDGTFGAAIPLPGGAAHTVAAIDLDDDGDLDLALTGDAEVVLRYNDRGAFAALLRLAVADRPNRVSGGDLDSDGVVDLLVALDAGEVMIVRGLGGGRFSPGARLTVGAGTQRALAVDLDGDGALDIVTADERGDDVAVLRGLGDGSFIPPAFYAAWQPHDLAVADFDLDGRPDVAVAGRSLGILRGVGGGRLAVGLDTGTEMAPVAVVAANLRGRGRFDLAVADPTRSRVRILHNTSF
ncbi:MAG: VCBS repeat-containing protein [Myxococcales bacterium]|nr:VCBS repeat-containing protein [Myxococcales bacterium]